MVKEASVSLVLTNLIIVLRIVDLNVQNWEKENENDYQQGRK